MMSTISGPKLLRSAFNEVDHLETLDPYSSAVSGHQGSNEQKKRNFIIKPTNIKWFSNFGISIRYQGQTSD